MSSPPTYRERLRLEGSALAACGVAGSAALWAAVPEARRWPLNTVAQVAAVAGLLAVLGPRSARTSMDDARELAPGEEGSGEPTPLWQLPLITAGLAGAFAALPSTGLPGSHLAGWDAALRITGGCAVVGLTQAVLLDRVVARDEAARRRRYLRVKGSRLLRGTKLGFTGA